jgi:hypothetical protein
VDENEKVDLEREENRQGAINSNGQKALVSKFQQFH